MTILYSKGLTDEDVSTNLEMGFHLNNHQAAESRFRPDLSDSKIYALKKKLCYIPLNIPTVLFREKKKKKTRVWTIIQILHRPVNST